MKGVSALLVKAEGIVIRTHDYGESHKVVVIFTREHGKVAVVARGVKKTKSTLSGVTQVLTHGQYLYFVGRGMGSLNQGETLVSHASLRQDILKLSYAAYIVELLDKMTEEKEPSIVLFDLLTLTLNFLEENKDPDILCRIFEIKLMGQTGYQPQLNSCAVCGANDEFFVFSVTKGGLVCIPCASPGTRSIAVSPTIVRLLRLFLHFDLNRLGQIQVREETKKQLERVMTQFIDYHTDLSLKSRKFLNQMKEQL